MAYVKQSPYYATDELVGPAITGKVYHVTLMIRKHDKMQRAMDFEKRYWPYQVNNVAEWYRRSLMFLQDRELIKHYTECRTFEGGLLSGALEFQINDGDGIKMGRDRGQTKFSIKSYALASSESQELQELQELQSPPQFLGQLDLVIRSKQYSTERYHKRKELAAEGRKHGLILRGDSWFMLAGSEGGSLEIAATRAEVEAAGLTPGSENV